MAEEKDTKKTTTTATTNKTGTTTKTGTLNQNSGVTSNNFADGTVPDEAANNQFLGAGLFEPIIRINDHYFSHDEIQYLELKSEDFVPTMELHILTSMKDLAKKNVIKDGDKAAIFVNSDLSGTIRSLRCDFLISHVEMADVIENYNSQKYSFLIYGELYVPDLHNETVNYSFSGSSRDALRDAAQKLKLGFYFNDANDTTDQQIWQCTPSSGGLFHFVQDVTSHAWGGNDFCYSSWIDFRYALSFINISLILGVDGIDTGMDLTKFTSIAVNTLNSEGKNVNSGNDKLFNYKIFNNIYKDANQFSTYYVLKYNLVNRSYEITKQVGIQAQTIININNTGVDTEANTVDVNAQIVYNHSKVDSGKFFILTGPGTNTTYKAADNGDYVQQQSITNVPVLQDSMSTSDVSTVAQTGSNEYASGNVSQTYELAAAHNYINNMQLEKMYINVECPGCNLSIVRGEKVPVLLQDRSSMNAVENEGDTNKNMSQSKIKSDYDIMGCGWFMINAISYVYNPFAQNVTSGANSWTTKVKLTRREWPTPVPVMDPSTAVDSSTATNSAKKEVSVNLAKTKSKVKDLTKATQNQNSSTATNTDTTESTDISAEQDSFEGLKSYMVDIYNKISEITNNNISLVSGRRYAVDASNNKVDGNAFVQQAGYYKCVNNAGEVLWFESYNSKHLYGEAIDIINKEGYAFEDIFNNIVYSDDTLELMYNNGVSMYIENSTDSGGVNVKHYHIGTDTIGQKVFWDEVYSRTGTYIVNGKSVANYVSVSSAEKEIVHDIVYIS